MNHRGKYGKLPSTELTAGAAAALGLIFVGVLLAPVVAIVGGTALATAASGHGKKAGGKSVRT